MISSALIITLEIKEAGVGNVVFAALSQTFFTLSIGIGAMLIFGSYLDKSRSLTGEAVSITVLDTLVALTAGFIIIPACFSYGIQPDAGASLSKHFATLVWLPRPTANSATRTVT